MTKFVTEITVAELVELLTSIKSSAVDVRIRVRLIGELWQKAFMKIDVADDGCFVLLDRQTNSALNLNDTQAVIQFELDKPYQQYKPQLHYTVKLN